MSDQARPLQARDIVRLEGERGFRRICVIRDGIAYTEACIPSGFIFNPDYKNVPVADLVDARADWEAVRKRHTASRDDAPLEGS